MVNLTTPPPRLPLYVPGFKEFSATFAIFSIATVSCLTGAVIRSTSIEAVGINVTDRRRRTAFVNV